MSDPLSDSMLTVARELETLFTTLNIPTRPGGEPDLPRILRALADAPPELFTRLPDDMKVLGDLLQCPVDEDAHIQTVGTATTSCLDMLNDLRRWEAHLRETFGTRPVVESRRSGMGVPQGQPPPLSIQFFAPGLRANKPGPTTSVPNKPGAAVPTSPAPRRPDR